MEKKTDLIALLESTIATEYKKWCSYETYTSLCRAYFFIIFSLATFQKNLMQSTKD